MGSRPRTNAPISAVSHWDLGAVETLFDPGKDLACAALAHGHTRKMPRFAQFTAAARSESRTRSNPRRASLRGGFFDGHDHIRPLRG